MDPFVIVDDLHEAGRVRALYAAMSRLRRMPAGLLFVPIADVERLAAGDAGVADKLGQYLPAELVSFLASHVERVKALSPVKDDLCGVEVFMSQHASMTPVTHGGFHVDSNEPDWDSAKVAFGSVFHLGPDHVPAGGGTALYPRLPVPEDVLSRCFRPTTHDELDALTNEWVVVEQKPNRVLVFDGRLPHYACRCSAKPEEPRIALVVTGWVTVPRFASKTGYSQLAPEHFRAFAVAPEEVLAELRGYLHAEHAFGGDNAAHALAALRSIAAL